MAVVSLRTGPGSLIARTAAALAEAKGSPAEAAKVARHRYRDTPDVALHLEAKASAVTTASGGPPLVVPGTSEFLGLVKPRTLLGRIPRLRRVPFNRGVAVNTGGGRFGWVAQGAPILVGEFAWQSASLSTAKAGGIAVFSNELLRLAVPAADAAITEVFVSGLAEFMDTALTDPSIAAVPDDSPASLTNGAQSFPATGIDAAAVQADLIALIKATHDDLRTLDGVVILMDDAIAFAIATLTNPAGGSLFPNLGVAGGSLYGIPVLTSSVVGNQIISVHAPSIMYADDGQMELESAKQTTLDMSPTPGSPAVQVSMFQTNSSATRITRWINWEPSRADAVHVLTDVEYAGFGS